MLRSLLSFNISASSFLRDIVEDQQNFRHSFRIKDITMQHLTNISQSAGHANVNTTLRHYCHSTDLLILGALNANRPEGYAIAVARYSGFSLRSLQRWNESNQFYKKSMAEIAKGSINIKAHDTPLPALDPGIERSFSFYKSCNLQGELSTRELWEWVRLFKIFEPTSCKELVSFIHTRMVSRASFRLASRIALRQFVRLNKSNGIATDFWEVKQPSTKSNRYTVLNTKSVYVYPIHIRLSYPQNEDVGNTPRRIFAQLIRALAGQAVHTY